MDESTENNQAIMLRMLQIFRKGFVVAQEHAVFAINKLHYYLFFKVEGRPYVTPAASLIATVSIELFLRFPENF